MPGSDPFSLTIHLTQSPVDISVLYGFDDLTPRDRFEILPPMGYVDSTILPQVMTTVSFPINLLLREPARTKHGAGSIRICSTVPLHLPTTLSLHDYVQSVNKPTLLLSMSIRPMTETPLLRDVSFSLKMCGVEREQLLVRMPRFTLAGSFQYL
ncbi:hypothetical protein J6590_043944 [Homalodisca vitripennis]|nr:hypothetical protein J6590_043944 [Homalodisca vitripennis]